MGVFDRLPGLAGGDEATQDESTGAEGAEADDRPETDGSTTPTEDPAAMDPVDYRDRAEALAARSNVPTLDFTVASLEKLDTMVEGPTIPVEDPVAIGSYLGETLVRAYDGSWVRDDGPAVAVDLDEDDTRVAVFDAAQMALEQGPLFQDVAARLEAEGATPIDGVPPVHREVDASTAQVVAPAADPSDEAADEPEKDEHREVADQLDDAVDEQDEAAGESDQAEDESDELEDESDAVESEAGESDALEDAGNEDSGAVDADERDDAVEPEDTDDAEPVQADEPTPDEGGGRDGDAAEDAEPAPAIRKVDEHERSDAEDGPDATMDEDDSDDLDADDDAADVAVDEGSDADGGEPEVDSVDARTEDDDSSDDEQGDEPVDEDLDAPASTAAGAGVAGPATGRAPAVDGDDEPQPDDEPTGEQAAAAGEAAPDEETPGEGNSDPADGQPAADGTEVATASDADDPAEPAATTTIEGDETATADGDEPETADVGSDDEASADDGGPEPAEDGTDDAPADDDVDPALDVTVDEIELDEDDEPASPVDAGSLPGSGAEAHDGGATAADAQGEGDTVADDEAEGDSLGVAADIADLAAAGGDADDAEPAAVDADSDEGSTPPSPADAGGSGPSTVDVDPGEGPDADETGAVDGSETSPTDAGSPGTDEGDVDGDDTGATADEPAPDETGEPPSRVAVDDRQTPFTAARDDGTLEALAAELAGTTMPPRPELKRAAREFAEAWSDREFDVSPASLARLDDFLDGQWNGRFEPASLADESPHPRDGLPPLARVGAYVGQVLVEHLDGEWVPTENGEGAVEVDGRGGTTEEVPVFDVARSCMTGESTLSYQFDALANRVGSEASARDVDDVFDVRDRRADSTAVIPAILDRAESFTARWPSASLDYAPASLPRLDDLVEEEFDVADRSGVHVGESTDPDSLLLTERVTSAAAYYATVCVNHLDANWRIEGDVALAIEGPAGARTVDPVSVAAGAIRGEDTFVGHFERTAERVGRESAIPE